MIAVSEVDRAGGAILVSIAALYFLGAGCVEFLRAYVNRPPRGDDGTAGLPSAPRQARSVEAGTFVAAEATYCEGVAGRSSRPPSAATSIEALTFPGPYSRVGNRR